MPPLNICSGHVDPDPWILVGTAALTFTPPSLRLENIKSLEYVDEAFIINDSIEKALLKHKPGIVVKGKEHEFKYNIEVHFEIGRNHKNPKKRRDYNIVHYVKDTHID